MVSVKVMLFNGEQFRYHGQESNTQITQVILVEETIILKNNTKVIKELEQIKSSKTLILTFESYDERNLVNAATAFPNKTPVKIHHEISYDCEMIEVIRVFCIFTGTFYLTVVTIWIIVNHKR